MFMDIFVISLEKSKERRCDFDYNNSKYIKYKYFNAIDGKTLSVDKLDERIFKKIQKITRMVLLGVHYPIYNYGKNVLK